MTDMSLEYIMTVSKERGVMILRVEVDISPDVTEPYAIVRTKEITEEIQKLISAFEKQGKVIATDERDRMMVLTVSEVYMVRVEDCLTVIYTRDKRYVTRKKLYEALDSFGKDFMQISKAAIVNLKYLDYVEPYFNGTMKLMLKNGCGEYISRKYLQDFKKYLGI